ncbi:hypothetical protein DCAR_0310862 [Daucus carota subsp. sativus]|uniref:Thioesterase domain-containing protein n=1 Tax=Daucus carota subsp. sativus TaxID=79200 RepID=A0AAF0WNP4_DAUCS|nr:PREDICTED: acyl-coenzyme A thioesterase 13 [Daucus carota subsp. sativus]WOG91613.1 hypothetical protein DCAR_0310862 [Daucus carota subsp. sativus]
MNFDEVKRQLEQEGNSKNGSIVDSMPFKFFEPFIVQGIKVDLVEPGRVICSMTVPPRLLNTANSLHGGATAALVDILGSAAIYTTKLASPGSGVSVEISVSYVDAAYAGEEIEIESKVLRVGKAIAVVTVELRKKKTGKVIAHGRHTKYLAVASKL